MMDATKAQSGWMIGMERRRASARMRLQPTAFIAVRRYDGTWYRGLPIYNHAWALNGKVFKAPRSKLIAGHLRMTLALRFGMPR